MWILPLLLLWSIYFALALLVSLRQRRLGDGSRRRWLAASAAAGVAGILPVLAGLILHTQRSDAVDPWFRFVPAFALLGSPIAFALFARTLRPPRVPGAGAEPPPLVTDEGLLGRVRELSGRLGMLPPRVRQFHTPGSGQTALAWATGLAAPTLVVTDGIVNRLQAAECDAVLAHELAHHANGSLWVLAAVGPFAVATAVLASALVPPVVAFFLAFGAAMVVRRLAGHWMEVDCDLRAARLVGHRTVASALEKIHAVHVVRTRGWLGFLVYAFATHPHPQIRARALHRDAPPGEAEGIVFDAALARRSRAANAVALALAVAAALAGLSLGVRPEGEPPAAILLALAIGTPSALLLAAMQSARRRRRRRFASRRPIGAVAIRMGVVLLLFALLSWLYLGGLGMERTTGLLGGALLVGGLLATRKLRALRRKVLGALVRNDFAAALAAGQSAPAIVAGDPGLRHALALTKAVLGDPEGALTDLRDLAAAQRPLPMASISLATLLLESDPEEARAAAERAARTLPDDPVPAALHARALRALDRGTEAAPVVAAARGKDPHSGWLAAVAASLALDQGDTTSALRLVEEALRLEPGDPYALLVRAEIAAAAGPPETARAAAAEAVRAAERQPLEFLLPAARRLHARVQGVAGNGAPGPGP